LTMSDLFHWGEKDPKATYPVNKPDGTPGNAVAHGDPSMPYGAGHLDADGIPKPGKPGPPNSNEPRDHPTDDHPKESIVEKIEHVVDKVLHKEHHPHSSGPAIPSKLPF